MTASESAYGLIRRFESLRLTSYRDPVGIWTVGYGHTQNAAPDQTITEQGAETFLHQDVSVVEGVLTAAIMVPATQNQFDACCSLAFNIGRGNFTKSTLLKKLNAGDAPGAAEEFLRWNHAGGQVLPGLTARRIAEQQLFQAVAPSATPPAP